MIQYTIYKMLLPLVILFILLFFKLFQLKNKINVKENYESVKNIPLLYRRFK